MSTYLLINLLIIIFPLAMSFESKVRYITKFRHVLLSILIVSLPYIMWDVIAANRGDWSFNNEYILGFRLFSLPVEEILFFITVPFSSIFIYESLSVYLKEFDLKISRVTFTGISVLLFAAAVLFIDKYYTFTVLIFSGMFLSLANMIYPVILNSRLYWIFILFMFIPFFIVNYILTSLPVVQYNSGAIIGIRILTIPMEDIFYSFSMLSFYLLVYLILRERWQLKTKLQ